VATILVQTEIPLPVDFRDLGANMRRVLRLHRRTREKLDAKNIHDLRVALRTCISAADGMLELDGHEAWILMRKAARRLFDKLGDLRDTQVQRRWVRKISAVRDSASRRLLRSLDSRREKAERGARRALKRFDRASWRRLASLLSRRASQVPPGDLAFGQLALQRWTHADALHFKALEKRTRGSYHQLRIALKRFRYTLEGFLPTLGAQLSKDLRRIQEVLGEVHDLDVLDALVKRCKGLRPGARKRWRQHLEREIQRRITRYRKLSMGERALYSAWRAALPGDDHLRESAVAWLAAWAHFHDARPEHTARVARLALQLFDAFSAARVRDPFHDEQAREKLEAASFLFAIEQSGKRASRRIRVLQAPIGWSRFEMDYVADIVRSYGREGTKARFSARPAEQRQAIVRLAAVLKLAISLEQAGVNGLSLEVSPEAVIVRAEGLDEHSKAAQQLTKAKQPLETALDRLLLVKAADYAMARPAALIEEEE
jgi:CHAD domain-containing protein